jgi:hypothetical protein
MLNCLALVLLSLGVISCLLGCDLSLRLVRLHKKAKTKSAHGILICLCCDHISDVINEKRLEFASYVLTGGIAAYPIPSDENGPW